MKDIVSLAIQDFQESPMTYTKFITPNDTGKTGGHQAGYHIHKNAWNLFFDKAGIKGTQTELFIKIKWQNDFVTDSRFVYYGKKTRNEYRLTRYGRNFPFLKDDNVGDYLILCKQDKQYYHAYVLSHDTDIEEFLSGVGISITDTNKLFVKQQKITVEKTLEELINNIVDAGKEFPVSKFVSEQAQIIYNKINKITDNDAVKAPDKLLLGWVETEYKLFKAIELKYYSQTVVDGFKTLDSLIDTANTILNRRKSRAGKALENHLASMFTLNNVKYETQVKTEGNKKPDFIFPDGKSYHNVYFNVEGLFFLGAKTTCKDRWRQILNEASRIETKHLMTLQQGISKNQLEEMEGENVVLVVPESYKSSFPKEHRQNILSLEQFIQTVKITQ